MPAYSPRPEELSARRCGWPVTVRALMLSAVVCVMGCDQAEEPVEGDATESERGESDAENDAEPSGSDTESSDSESTDEPPTGTDIPAPDEEDPCLQTPPGADELPSSSGSLRIELGARNAETGVDFLPLGETCVIPIGGIGQAGLTARLALRTWSEEPVRDAYVRITLVNFSDPERDPAPNNGPGVVRRFDCREDGWCYLVPILVEISHLNRLPELEGTVVTFSAEVVSSEDSDVSGASYGWGHFVLEDEIALSDAGAP